MDQGGFLILFVAAMLAQEPAPACRTVNGARLPQLTDIKLDKPAVLSTNDKEMLGRLAVFMREQNCKVVVQGFRVPGAKENEDLERANAVKDFLTKDLPEPQRVRSNQVEVQAKGFPALPKRSVKKGVVKVKVAKATPTLPKRTVQTGFARVVP